MSKSIFLSVACPFMGRIVADKSAATPIVIKASGLALGKGVMVCQTLDEAKNFLQDIMVNKIFGEAGKKSL